MVNEVGEEWKDDKDIDDGSRKEVTNDPPHGPAGNRLNRQVIHFLSSYIILVSSKISLSIFYLPPSVHLPLCSLPTRYASSIILLLSYCNRDPSKWLIMKWYYLLYKSLNIIYHSDWGWKRVVGYHSYRWAGVIIRSYDTSDSIYYVISYHSVIGRNPYQSVKQRENYVIPISY